MTDSLIKSLGGRIIYLVGMMGSGKSMTGPLLAELLNYSFIDQDTLIEKIAKTSIQNIFQENGECGFRNLETKVLKEIGMTHSLVVATGGGIVTRSENWGILHQGIVVWINPSLNCLMKRLQLETSNRPLLNENDLTSTLQNLIKDRHSLYSESDLEISVDEQTPKEVAEKIYKKLLDVIQN